MSALKPLDQQQKKASNALSFAILGILVGMNVVAWAMGIWPDWISISLAVVGSAFFAIVNFKNTFSKNANWKSIGGFIQIILTVLLYAIPISRHA